jgi:hypothetical protein
LNGKLYAATMAATVGGALLAPAASQAQTPGTLVPQTQCIRFVDASLKTFPLQGAGFAPNALVSVASDGAPLDSIQADAAGSFSGAISAPLMGTNSNRENVSITADDGQGHPAGPLALPEVRLTVDWPDRVRGNKRVLFRAYGFPEAGKNVYLHVRKRGRSKGTFSLGKADAPCGLTKRRMRYLPISRPATGVYDYYFDQNKKFSRSTTLIRFTVTFTRTFRSLNATASAQRSAVVNTSRWASLAPLGL